jgi:hypothetical protein
MLKDTEKDFPSLCCQTFWFVDWTKYGSQRGWLHWDTVGIIEAEWHQAADAEFKELSDS